MGRVITRKPILPSEEELEENSRSKSAKLRVFERGECCLLYTSLERDNYLQAVASEHMIKEDELRQLVNRMGMQLGLKAGDSYREDAGGRGYRETAPDEGASFKGASEGRTGNGDGTKSRRRPEREDGIRRSQRLLLTWLIEDPALFDKDVYKRQTYLCLRIQKHIYIHVVREKLVN